MGCIKMKMKPKEVAAAFVGAAIAAIVLGVCLYVLNRPKWPDISERSFDAKLRADFAKSIQNGLIRDARIDEDRQNKAFRVLMDNEVNDTVIFLWNGVVKHNIYGYMFEIIFVDRTARVWNVVYEDSGQSETTQASRSILHGSKEMSGRERTGGLCLKMILCASNDLIESTVSDVNRVEPKHLLLPQKLYNDIVSGKGKMLLLDKDGTTLDSLGITVVDSK
jgi:hypothetical protein